MAVKNDKNHLSCLMKKKDFYNKKKIHSGHYKENCVTSKLEKKTYAFKIGRKVFRDCSEVFYLHLIRNKMKNFSYQKIFALIKLDKKKDFFLISKTI